MSHSLSRIEDSQHTKVDLSVIRKDGLIVWRVLNLSDKEIGWKMLWKLPKSWLCTVLSSAPNGPNLIPFQNRMCSTAEIFPATHIWGWFNLDHIYISLLLQSVVGYSHLQARILNLELERDLTVTKVISGSLSCFMGEAGGPVAEWFWQSRTTWSIMKCLLHCEYILFLLGPIFPFVWKPEINFTL